MSRLSEALARKYGSQAAVLRHLGMDVRLLDEEDGEMAMITCDQNRYDRNGKWLGGQVFDTAPGRRGGRDQQLKLVRTRDEEGEEGGELAQVCEMLDRAGILNCSPEEAMDRLRRSLDRRRAEDDDPELGPLKFGEVGGFGPNASSHEGHYPEANDRRRAEDRRKAMDAARMRLYKAADAEIHRAYASDAMPRQSHNEWFAAVTGHIGHST